MMGFYQAQKIEKLEKRIAALEAALKPFAEAADLLEETDEDEIYEWAVNCDILRAARTAMENKND